MMGLEPIFPEPQSGALPIKLHTQWRWRESNPRTTYVPL
jgi:hypothetical protein